MIVAIASLSVPQFFFTTVVADLCVVITLIENYYYSIVLSIIYLILPFTIMLACSIIMIVKLRQMATALHMSDERRSRDYDFAKTILANIYFLSIMLPYCIIGMIINYYRSFEIIFLAFHIGQYTLAYNVFTSLINFYHSTTFIIHLTCNKLFRSVLSKFFASFFAFKIFNQSENN